MGKGGRDGYEEGRDAGALQWLTGQKSPPEAAGAMLRVVRHWEMGDVATPSLTPRLCCHSCCCNKHPEVSVPPTSHHKGPSLLGSAMHLPLPLPPSPPSHIPAPQHSGLAQMGRGSGHGMWETMSFSSHDCAAVLPLAHPPCIPPCSPAGLNRGRHGSTASLAQHGRTGNAEQLCTTPVSANKQTKTWHLLHGDFSTSKLPLILEDKNPSVWDGQS